LDILLILWDLGLWLGYTSIILLVTTVFISIPYSQVQIRIDKKIFNFLSIVISIAFIITVVINFI